MEELTEVITAAEFHPQECNLLMYSSSKGTVKLADMRESALCDQNAKGMWNKEATIESNVPSNICIQQYSKHLKIPTIDPSFPKSFRLYPMSNSVLMVDTF